MQSHQATTPPALGKNIPSTVPLTPIHEAPRDVSTHVATTTTPTAHATWKSDAPASLGAVGVNLLASMLIIFLLLFGLMAWLKQNPKLLAVLQQWQGGKASATNSTPPSGLPGAAFMSGTTPPKTTSLGNLCKGLMGLWTSCFGSVPLTHHNLPSAPPSLALKVLDETWLPGHQSALCWVKAGPQVLLMSAGLAQAPQVLGRMPYDAWQHATRAGTLPQGSPSTIPQDPPQTASEGFVLNLRKSSGDI